MRKEGFLNAQELEEARRLLRTPTHKLEDEDIKRKSHFIGRLFGPAIDQLYLVEAPENPHRWVMIDIIRDENGFLVASSNKQDPYANIYEDPYGVLEDSWEGAEAHMLKICSYSGNVVFSEPPKPPMTEEQIQDLWARFDAAVEKSRKKREEEIK